MMERYIDGPNPDATVKKVCFVIFGVAFSGAENVLIQYLKNNVEIDAYFLIIFAGEALSHFKQYFDDSKIFLLNIKYSKNELRFLPAITQRRLCKAAMPVIREIKPDVLYINNTLEIALSKALIKTSGIPAIGHVHDMKKSIGTPAKRYEIQMAFKYLKRIVAVSEACKRSWNNPKIQVVYNGLPDDFWIDRLDNIPRRKNEKYLTIGFVGMISRIKGIDILADAIARTQCNIRWIIVYNSYEKSFEKYIHILKKKDNVQLYYQLKYQEMKEFYDNIDILVITSREDSLPTVAIEAMSRGIIVTGFSVGGIPELLGDSQLITSGTTADALLERINFLQKLSNQDLRKIRECLYGRARNMFNLKTKCNIINQIIRDSAQEKDEI